jgi:hypothetical protein
MLIIIPSTDLPLHALSSALPQFVTAWGLARLLLHTYCMDNRLKALGMNFPEVHPFVSSSSHHRLFSFAFYSSSCLSDEKCQLHLQPGGLP